MLAEKPIEYRNKKLTFLNREFYIDGGAHIPRKSTEFIAQQYIDYVKSITSEVSVVDVGTGSGVLAVSVAQECTNVAKVYAIDLYEEALRVAAINVGKYGLGSRVELMRGDLLLPINDKHVDVILANLPFADDKKMQLLRPEVREYEPLTGIYGGKDGFEVYVRLFDQLSDYKYFDGIKGVWVYCYKEHLQQVKRYENTLFKDFKLKLVDDAFKEYYQHCLFYKS